MGIPTYSPTPTAAGADMTNANANEHADSGWDDYAERVLRNEGRLQGLEVLVAETRAADGKLIEARSASLARELERRADALLELVTARADAVLTLSQEERAADRREVEILFTQQNQSTLDRVAAQRREGQLALSLLREVYDTAIRQNYEQSREAIAALEQRREAATERLEQMVRQWRDSDERARELYATETNRHLEQLNHNNERMANFQAKSVTRELWQAEKDAAITREGLLRDQIIAVEKLVLGMTPTIASDRAHNDLRIHIEKSVASMSEVLANKIAVVDEKVADLRTYRDTTTGKASGYSALYGWIVAAVGLLATVIVTANAFTR